MAKSGEKEKWGLTVGKKSWKKVVGKSGEKLGKVGKSWEKWETVGKSGKSWKK